MVWSVMEAGRWPLTLTPFAATLSHPPSPNLTPPNPSAHRSSWTPFARVIGNFFLTSGVEGGVNGSLFELGAKQVDGPTQDEPKQGRINSTRLPVDLSTSSSPTLTHTLPLYRHSSITLTVTLTLTLC